jgi:5-methylcytosine-specific restriction enzyme subunit McrC
MRLVFEDFLRNFYRFEQTEYEVSRETLNWAVSNASEGDRRHLPKMQTDITLRNAFQSLIIEAKYYAKGALGGGRTFDPNSAPQEKLRSSHLYQLLAYVLHERIRTPQRPLVGMLIYPDIGRTVRLRYELMGIPTVVATVDMDKEWREIATELLGLPGFCATRSRAAA